jgi:hypothetical protein
VFGITVVQFNLKQVRIPLVACLLIRIVLKNVDNDTLLPMKPFVIWIRLIRDVYPNPITGLEASHWGFVHNDASCLLRSTPAITHSFGAVVSLISAIDLGEIHPSSHSLEITLFGTLVVYFPAIRFLFQSIAQWRCTGWARCLCVLCEYHISAFSRV